MASKRRLRRKACCGKKQYGTHAEAATAAWRARVHTGENIHGYKCPHGNHFHIGHASAGRCPFRDTRKAIRFKNRWTRRQ